MDSDELRWTEPNDAPGVGTLVGGALDPDEIDSDFEPGAKLGRYVVLARMGAGAMGVVYAAYDPQLDRRIALKLMHQRGNDEALAERASRRMLAEAKAMAQLSHPNVIAVHDVGTIDGRVFIAMEFVDGVPLSEWIHKSGRNWQQLLEIFIKAGRGLEAAHLAGLVHRDFKPDNVLVGDDGRVRVLDFGLARRFDGTRDPGERRDREAGTPAYMSPEQHLGNPLDHRADQFSFCVALYEALYGELPFAAKTRLELALAVTDGRVGPAPKRASVPNWLRWALLRGLDPDPEGRWPDMGELLTELGRDPNRRMRTVTKWAAGALGVVAVALVAYQFKPDGGETAAAEPPACTSATEEIAEVWDRDRAAAIRKAFATGETTDGTSELADRVEAGLGAWAEQWTAMHIEACEASAKGAQSDTMLDRRMLCLARQLAEFGDLVEVLASGEAESLARAGEAVRQLPVLAECEAAAIEQGRSSSEHEAAQQDSYDAIERELFRARNLELTGTFDEAIATAEVAAEAAAEHEFQDLRANALLIQAQVGIAIGRRDLAATQLEQAELAAERAGADRLRGKILVTLARLEAASGNAEGARARVSEARAVLERVGSEAVAFAELDGVSAFASLAAGELELAEQQVRAAIDSIADIEPPALELARLHATLGVILRELERPVEARRALERAEKLWVGHYGAQHPNLAELRYELAVLDARQGRHTQAVANYRRAIAVFEQVFSETSASVADASAAMAESLSELGHYDQALLGYQRARAIYRAGGDAARVELAKVLDAEGVVHRRRGELQQALSQHQQALHILERAEGVRGFGRADLVPVLVHLGAVLVELDRAPDAREHIGLALELMGDGRGEHGREAESLADARTIAAKAWATGEEADLERARELARLARAAYVELERADSVAEIDTWAESLE